MRNGVPAEFDAPLVLKAFNEDNTVKNNYVIAEKNWGNNISKKYMIVIKEWSSYSVSIFQDKWKNPCISVYKM